MKSLELTLILFALLYIVLSMHSCKGECDDVKCENGGTCVEGTCQCPVEYIGDNCESFNPALVQTLLDGGKTPQELFEGNISLDDLYGKTYKGGLIFFVDAHDEVDGLGGLVAAPEDISRYTIEERPNDIPYKYGGAEWGCNWSLLYASESEFQEALKIGAGAKNTRRIIDCDDDPKIAAKICDELLLDPGYGWFLPSKDELEKMYINLHKKGHGDFASYGFYWSSSVASNTEAFARAFGSGYETLVDKNVGLHVRPARVFY